jgi:hypothetical protein
MTADHSPGGYPPLALRLPDSWALTKLSVDEQFALALLLRLEDELGEIGVDDFARLVPFVQLRRVFSSLKEVGVIDGSKPKPGLVVLNHRRIREITKHVEYDWKSGDRTLAEGKDPNYLDVPFAYILGLEYTRNRRMQPDLQAAMAMAFVEQVGFYTEQGPVVNEEGEVVWEVRMTKSHLDRRLSLTARSTYAILDRMVAEHGILAEPRNDKRKVAKQFRTTWAVRPDALEIDKLNHRFLIRLTLLRSVSASSDGFCRYIKSIKGPQAARISLESLEHYFVSSVAFVIGTATSITAQPLEIDREKNASCPVAAAAINDCCLTAGGDTDPKDPSPISATATGGLIYVDTPPGQEALRDSYKQSTVHRVFTYHSRSQLAERMVSELNGFDNTLTKNKNSMRGRLLSFWADFALDIESKVFGEDLKEVEKAFNSFQTINDTYTALSHKYMPAELHKEAFRFAQRRIAARIGKVPAYRSMAAALAVVWGRPVYRPRFFNELLLLSDDDLLAMPDRAHIALHHLAGPETQFSTASVQRALEMLDKRLNPLRLPRSFGLDSSDNSAQAFCYRLIRRLRHPHHLDLDKFSVTGRTAQEKLARLLERFPSLCKDFESFAESKETSPALREALRYALDRALEIRRASLAAAKEAKRLREHMLGVDTSHTGPT